MKVLFTILFTISSLFAISSPYKNISHSDKINALVNYFIQQDIDKLPKPPKKLNLKKDMFETSEQFKQRVANKRKNSDKTIAKYKKKVNNIKKYSKDKALKKAISIVYGTPKTRGKLNYDADTQYFFTSVKLGDKTQKIGIKVPIKIAKDFYQNFKKVKVSSTYKKTSTTLALKSIDFNYKGKSYEALFTDKSFSKKQQTVTLKSDYDINSQIDTSITIASSDDPEIKRLNEAILNAKRSNSTDIEKKRLLAQLAKLQGTQKAFVDDIPALLKKAKKAKVSKNRWLFVVGIENYEYTESIDFSKRTALAFKKVVKKSLGVPESNCFTLINKKATYTGIRTKLKKMLRKVKKGDTIYFYYNGHGIPVPNKNNEPYMLSSELEPEYVSDYSELSLKNIYKKLSSSKASKVIAVVDSCFSGGADGKALLKGVAAARVVPKKVKFDTKKMVVLSAGKGTEYSNGYDKKGHRLFSYFVMRSILKGDKKISSVYKNVYKNVKNTSFEEYGDMRVQHPTKDGNGKLRL